jgi:hypothetical protein
MRLPSDYVAPARLLAMFVLVTCLPLAALGWLGQRVLEQMDGFDVPSYTTRWRSCPGHPAYGGERLVFLLATAD